MNQTTAVTEAITNLNEAHRKFNLSPTVAPHFCREWQTPSHPLTETEKNALDRFKNRYLYYAG
ncbi:hypothetical protein C7B76_11010 [filamentous cyanobacterium CCP2]|nr:hypothetical protein C7B76_11010 [filamentous cyanobacterium CCP2]